MGSPTSRTLAYLRKEGWTACIVERYLTFARIRKDLLGCIDIVAVRPGTILGVQTTSASHIPARIDKAIAEPGLKAWLEAGGVFHVHGWSKKGKKGKRKTWQLRCEVITLEDL